jgi:hypothetical protein
MESNLKNAFRRVLLVAEQFLDSFGIFRQRGSSSQKPAIAKHTLLDGSGLNTLATPKIRLTSFNKI